MDNNQEKSFSAIFRIFYLIIINTIGVVFGFVIMAPWFQPTESNINTLTVPSASSKNTDNKLLSYLDSSGQELPSNDFCENGKYQYVHLDKLSEFDPIKICSINDYKITKLPDDFSKNFYKYINITNLDLIEYPSCCLPPGIKGMSKLKEISITGNFSNIDEIGHVYSLEEVHLGNKIQKIPSTIGFLKNVTWLDLKNNIIDEIPPEIGGMRSLSWLVLNNNKLNRLPPEIGNIINLGTLNLQNNLITELPKEIGKLSKLRSLELNNNPINILPKEISNLTNLERICIQGTGLTEAYVRNLLPKVKIYTGICSVSNTY